MNILGQIISAVRIGPGTIVPYNISFEGIGQEKEIPISDEGYLNTNNRGYAELKGKFDVSTRAVKLKVVIEPKKGPVGIVAKVYSTSHTAGSPVSFYLDAVRQTYFLKREIASHDGSCACNIIIPRVMKGFHYFWVKDENTGQTGVVPFEVM